jgi:hypothetical protein
MAEDFTFFPHICDVAADQVVESALAIGAEVYRDLWEMFEDVPVKRRPHLMAAVIVSLELEMRRQMVANAVKHVGLDAQHAVALLDEEIERKRKAAGPKFRLSELEFINEVLAGVAPVGTVFQ